MLKYLSDTMDVEKIRGTFTGDGRGASIGPVFERDDRPDYQCKYRQEKEKTNIH